MKRPMYYALDGHEPVALSGPTAVLQWGRWFEKAKRQVAFTDLGFGSVSTVFLGVDHRHWGDGPPIVFETMVFENPTPGQPFPEELAGLTRRYATWDEAEAGHAEMVAEVREKFWQQRRANGK